MKYTQRIAVHPISNTLLTKCYYDLHSLACTQHTLQYTITDIQGAVYPQKANSSMHHCTLCSKIQRRKDCNVSSFVLQKVFILTVDVFCTCTIINNMKILQLTLFRPGTVHSRLLSQTINSPDSGAKCSFLPHCTVITKKMTKIK